MQPASIPSHVLRMPGGGVGDGLRELLFLEIEHGGKQIPLVLEMMVKRAAGDAGAAGDGLDIGFGVAEAGEEAAGSLDQGCAGGL